MGSLFANKKVAGRLAVSVLALGLVVGCAAQTTSTDAEAQAEQARINDPIESVNRGIFSFNMTLDKYLMKPVAQVYRDYVPREVRDRIHDFLNNLREPLTFANEVLQLEPKRAIQTAGRFGINSTIGFFGAVDVMAAGGAEAHHEDFGQTLGVWGVPEGPYIMLPFFGPSNPRDAVGMGVDHFLDPLGAVMHAKRQDWYTDTWPSFGRMAANTLDKRERYLDALDEVERTSIDFYASLRSMYRQRRADEIRNGKSSGNLPAPGISFEEPESQRGKEISQR
jgi:phospholipid-binding lipoprotein MlaA